MTQFEISQLSFSTAMLGIIWLIQLVHYPSFFFIKEESFTEAMRHHQSKISIIVLPLMAGELGLAIWGVFKDTTLYSLLLLTIVMLLWLITFTVHVPLHTKLLSEGFNKQRIEKLVLTNWMRTLLWSVKLFVILCTAI